MSKVCACRLCAAHAAAGRTLFDPSTVVWEVCVRPAQSSPWLDEDYLWDLYVMGRFDIRAHWRAGFDVNRPGTILHTTTA